MPASVFSLCNISDTIVDDLGAPVIGLEFIITQQNQVISGQPLAYNKQKYRTDQNGRITFNAPQGTVISIENPGTAQYLVVPYPIETRIAVPASGSAILRNLAPISFFAPSPIGLTVQQGGVSLPDKISTLNFTGGVTVTESSPGVALINVTGGGGNVTSVFGRTGAVVALANDYSFSLLSGNISVNQMNNGTNASAGTFWRGDGTWQAAPGGNPGGLNTQLQYNNSGSFGGISGVTSNGTSITATAGNLIATRPQFITSIDDVNGKAIIALSSIGSAVNEVGIANAIATTGPIINTQGSDSNIDLNIQPKGSGNVIISANVGIGLSPIAGLDIQRTITASGGFAYGVRHRPTLNAGANNDQINSMFISPTYSDGGFTGVNHYALHITRTNDRGVRVDGTVTSVSSVSGNFNPGYAFEDETIYAPAGAGTSYASISTAPSVSGTTGVGTLTSFICNPVLNGNLTITQMFGLSSLPTNNNQGTVTQMFGYYTQGTNNSNIPTGTVTTSYGLFVDTFNNFGNMTNNYGIWIADNSAALVSGVTHSYNLFSNGSASLNVFAGLVGIGPSDPIDPLSISTAINASATHALFNLSNSALSSGSGSGTYIGANPSSFSGDWIDLQINNNKQFVLNSSGLISLYNKVATAGWGVVAIYSDGRLTAQTSAATVTTFTVGSSDGSFEVSSNVLVTVSTTHSFQVKCAYTDESGIARTATFNFSQQGGTLLTSITNTMGAGPYMGLPLHIRCKAGTTITITTSGTFTSVTYNVEAIIRELA